MVNGLPSVLTRPPAVLGSPAPAAQPEPVVLRSGLDAGIPARTVLTDDLSIVLSVGAGRIRRFTDADPADVLVAFGATSVEPDPGAYRDPDALTCRLTLVSGTTLGESAPVVPGLPVVLGVGGRAILEVAVSALTITNGSLRSPGQYGSASTLAWRDLRPAPDGGPVLPAGDPSIPARVVWKRLPLLWFAPGILATRYVLPDDVRWVS